MAYQNCLEIYYDNGKLHGAVDLQGFMFKYSNQQRRQRSYKIDVLVEIIKIDKKTFLKRLAKHIFG